MKKINRLVSSFVFGTALAFGTPTFADSIIKIQDTLQCEIYTSSYLFSANERPIPTLSASFTINLSTQKPNINESHTFNIPSLDAVVAINTRFTEGSDHGLGRLSAAIGLQRNNSESFEVTRVVKKIPQDQETWFGTLVTQADTKHVREVHLKCDRKKSTEESVVEDTTAENISKFQFTNPKLTCLAFVPLSDTVDTLYPGKLEILLSEVKDQPIQWGPLKFQGLSFYPVLGCEIQKKDQSGCEVFYLKNAFQLETEHPNQVRLGQTLFNPNDFGHTLELSISTFKLSSQSQKEATQNDTAIPTRVTFQCVLDEELQATPKN